jgi:ketosteroid isomerase-like protein
MDEQGNRAVVERIGDLYAKGDLDGLFDLYHDDVVLDWPQSGERIVGKANCINVFRNYPGGQPKPTTRGIRVSGDLAVGEAIAEYPDGSTWYLTLIFELRDGKVARETDYFSQAFEAPEWRAQWVEKV